jgi:hypothetical protein
MVGANLAALMFVVAGILLVNFLQSRPVNLQPHTEQLADALEQALKDNFIPTDSLHRSPPEVRIEKNVHWNFYRFEAVAPPKMNPEGLAKLLRDAMVKYDATVRELDTPPPNREITLAIGGHEFARVLFHPQPVAAAPAVAPVRMDLHLDAQRLAKEVEEAVRAENIDPQRLGAEDKEDKEALWVLTRMKAMLPSTLSPGELSARIAAKITIKGVEATVTSGEAGVDVLHFACIGKDCVEIECQKGAPLQPPAASPQQEPKADTSKQKAAEATTPMGFPSMEELPLESAEHQEGEPAPPKPPALPKGVAPRLAVILDDGGYNGKVTEHALQLDKALAFAILPNTPKGKETAEAGKQAGFEIMLHMPMSTHGKKIKPYPGQLETNMDKDQIQKLTRDALDAVPGVSGVNNHTGSWFTEDKERVGYFMDVLKEKGLFFVDSRTLNTSKGYAVAKEKGVPTGQRDVFLDNSPDPAKIRAQWKAAVQRAKTHGQAIAIGHFRDKTVDVLAEELPKLAQEGIKLVHVSELLK